MIEFPLLPLSLTCWENLGISSSPWIFISLGEDGPVTLVVSALLRGGQESKHRCECILKSETHFPGQSVSIHLTAGRRR